MATFSIFPFFNYPGIKWHADDMSQIWYIHIPLYGSREFPNIDLFIKFEMLETVHISMIHTFNLFQATSFALLPCRIAGIFFIHCTCILITNTNFANLNMICVTLKETINLLIPCRIKKSLFYEHFTGWTTVLCNPLLVASGQDIWYSAFKDWCHIISLQIHVMCTKAWRNYMVHNFRN